MSLITLDFESPYKKKTDEQGEKFTLRTMTYEEYIRSPRFVPMGVGIKIDDGKTVFYRAGPEIKLALEALFTPGNDHILLAHNTMFDAAILSWYYGLRAARYWCTQAMSTAIWPCHSASLENLLIRLFPQDETKRKGNELASFDGFWPEDMTEGSWDTYGGYCINDVDITFDAFCEMWKWFPSKELDVINMTLQMFIHPTLVLAVDEVKAYLKTLELKVATLVKESGISKVILASAPKFAKYVLEHHNIIVPIIPSPTIANPDNERLALAKTDLEFIKIQKEHPALAHLWTARLCATSTGELNRCKRLILHADPVTNTIAVPLKYYGAHTGRWSGTNSVNFQNFKRKSPLRTALYAPAGHKVAVRDLANIEGRVNAWFNGQWDKCQAFAEGRDLYNESAQDIFGYKVDRKAKVTDRYGNFLNAAGIIVENEDDADYLQFMEGFVGKTSELGLGYGMGYLKFIVQCAVLGGVYLEDDFARQAVNKWRNKNYKIVAGWKIAERAIFDMASPNMEPYQWGPIWVERGRLLLPNGCALVFPGLKQVTEDGETFFSYWNGKFYKKLYGGLLMENIIQALSRIILSDAMLRTEVRIATLGGVIVLTVHDEEVAVGPNEHIEEIFQIMGQEMHRVPEWADDRLALTSSGGIADNYSK